MSRRFELMLGAGPEIVRSWRPTRGLYPGATAGVELMFWPSERVGLWVETSYDLVFRPDASHGLGATGGLLVRM